MRDSLAAICLAAGDAIDRRRRTFSDSLTHHEQTGCTSRAYVT